MQLWDDFWPDSDVLKGAVLSDGNIRSLPRKDFRGLEIAKQMTRSIGSISANMEEGYGRGGSSALCVKL
jgi:four helix bundle protein